MKNTRRYDLDWLRVIGIIGVFLFHNSMFFNDWYWHVGNAVIYKGMDGFSSFFSDWIMPLFFVISGVSTRYALDVRSGGAFLKERVVRLLVPLMLGVFVLSPPQVYIENVTHGRFAGSFLAFFPHYFDGWYSITPNGNFAFMGLHLWYLLFYIYGFWLFANPHFKMAIRRHGPAAVIVALLTVILYIAWTQSAGFPSFGTQAFVWLGFLRALNGWSFLIALFYLGLRYLNRNNRALQYAGRAVMPFYILHQKDGKENGHGVHFGKSTALAKIDAAPTVGALLLRFYRIQKLRGE